MDAMSEVTEGAFRTLYRWVKETVTGLSRVPPHVHPLLPTAIQTLKSKEPPILLLHCLEEIGLNRGKALRVTFVRALVEGDSATRPIELHAHDPGILFTLTSSPFLIGYSGLSPPAAGRGGRVVGYPAYPRPWQPVDCQL